MQILALCTYFHVYVGIITLTDMESATVVGFMYNTVDEFLPLDAKDQ